MKEDTKMEMKGTKKAVVMGTEYGGALSLTSSLCISFELCVFSLLFLSLCPLCPLW